MDNDVVWMVFLGAVVFGLIVVFLVPKVLKRTRLARFSRSMASVIDDAKDVDGHMDSYVARQGVDTVFQQSALSRSNATPIQVIEPILFSLHARRRGAVSKPWDHEGRVRLQQILSELKIEMPYSAVSGEPRQLLETAAGMFDKSHEGGPKALGLLATHIAATEKQLTWFRKLSAGSFIVSIVGIAIAVGALVQAGLC